MDLGNLLSFIWYSVQTNGDILAGLTLLTGVCLSFLWAHGEVLDRWVFEVINLRLPYSAWSDRVMHLSGQFGTLWMGLLIAAGAFVLGPRPAALVGAVAMLLLWGAVRAIKALTKRARPYASVTGARLVGIEPTGLAFPSGHAAQSFFTAYFLSQILGLAAVTWLLFLAAAFISFTRIYVGAHFPRDIIAGALIGLVFGFVLVRLLPYFLLTPWLAGG